MFPLRVARSQAAGGKDELAAEGEAAAAAAAGEGMPGAISTEEALPAEEKKADGGAPSS